MSIPQPAREDEDLVYQDEDRDSLTTLPLMIVPLENAGLRRARMIKNDHLESVIELFNDVDVGRGHIHPEQVDKFFSGVSLEDTGILTSLAKLPSYDVYSLRITLRKLGIEVDDLEHLQLSDGKQEELQAYMQPFLQKLTLNIFADGDPRAAALSDWRELFKHPDVRVTRRRLMAMSDKLGIPIDDIPRFLQDYGDVYLSVAYYRQCLMAIQPVIVDFVKSADGLLKHQQLGKDPTVAKNTGAIKKRVQKISQVLQQQFDATAHSTDVMFSEMNQESFDAFREMVEGGHDRLGALLCQLTVKMNAWQRRFPEDDESGPMRHADFINTEFRRGW